MFGILAASTIADGTATGSDLSHAAYRAYAGIHPAEPLVAALPV